MLCYIHDVRNFMNELKLLKKLTSSSKFPYKLTFSALKTICESTPKMHCC